MNTFKYIKPKLFSVLKDYSREQFAKDLIAGGSYCNCRYYRRNHLYPIRVSSIALVSSE